MVVRFLNIHILTRDFFASSSGSSDDLNTSFHWVFVTFPNQVQTSPRSSLDFNLTVSDFFIPVIET